MTLRELPWIETARGYLGTKEVKGPGTHPKISKWLLDLGAWYRDDETPWCGTFVAACLHKNGIAYPKNWMRAKAYLELPVKLSRPAYGAIVVFDREGGGHVGFVVGRDQYGNLMVLGGNQGDMVCIRAFPIHRVLGYFWPTTYPLEGRFLLPILNSNGQVSKNEA